MINPALQNSENLSKQVEYVPIFATLATTFATRGTKSSPHRVHVYANLPCKFSVSAVSRSWDIMGGQIAPPPTS